ncbi:MAG TPA: hypothetical protein DCX95_02480 [Elusimicrobia bacterium]|nr:hypothetical protein [Elusimicrobiota bacterium]
MDKKKILVIDDDQSVVSYLEFLLAIYGYSMEGASSGEEGLKKIEASLPDLIFLDLMMPKRNWKLGNWEIGDGPQLFG